MVTKATLLIVMCPYASIERKENSRETVAELICV